MKQLTILTSALLALLAVAPSASADKTIGEAGTGAGQIQSPQGLATDFETGRLYVADSGNDRIDVFEADGTFVKAFGWGVDTKAPELQTCTTASGCNAGIAGTGAGQFDNPPWIAVDNDPLSPSHHDVYVGSDSSRVQKFDSEGNFLSAFGYDVVAHGPDDSANDETQALTVKASGGAFKLKFEDPFSGGGTQETAPLPFNASAAELAAALNALSTIGGLGGSVAVSGSSPYLIDFEGNLGGDDVPALEVDASTLTGAAPSADVQEQHRGGALEVCDASAGELCKRGSAQPGGECEISRTSDPIAVGPGGEVYVADSYQAAPSTFTNRVTRFDAEGNCLGEVELFEGESQTIRDFAVDSVGDLYVTVAGGGGLLRKYDPSGALLYERGSNEAKTLATEAEGIVVDAADNVFAKQRGQQLTKLATDYFFTEYDSGGAIVERFGYVSGESLSVRGLAAYSSLDGDLFASQGPAGVKYLTLPQGPVMMPEACKVKAGALGNTKATLQAEVNPEGKATTIHFEYVDEEHFKVEGFMNPETTDESESIGADFEMHEAGAVADLDPETKYHCRVVATNADAPAGVTGPEGTFISKEPLEIGDTTVSDVGTETATLNATVNPLGISTTGYFEYVTEATYLKDIAELGPEHGFDHATKAPDVDAEEEAIDFGLGGSFKLGSATLSGLKPGTSYRLRIVATNLFFEEKGEIGVIGPIKAFRTFRQGAGALPDDRAWELVSPAQKNSAEVAVPGIAGGVFEDRSIRIQAGSGSGEAITYTSFSSFGEAASAPATSQYLSKRTASGWATENVSPLGFQRGVLVPPYFGFTPELTFGAFKVGQPALVPDCPEGIENLYLRDNESGALRCLSPEVPNNPTVGFQNCFTFAGASEDGSRAFFGAFGAYAGAPNGQGTSLYEWSAAQGLRVVSVLPGQSEPLAPTDRTSFGVGNGNCQVGQTNLRHVISADGSRAFWTYVPEGKEPTTQLLARVDGAETVQLDAAQGAAEKNSGNGIFWAASADGSVAYFTDANRLVPGSDSKPGEPDLYRYELDNEAGKRLTNLTLNKAGVPGDVGGVVGASDDGSYVYYVAGAVLSDEANDGGLKAVAGKDNLYLFHEGKTSFIATLAPDDPHDAADWSDQPKDLSARLTPDGRHLAFLSVETEALAGYDNTVSDGEHCRWNPILKELVDSPLCSQAFIYDAEADTLTCASCNPSGTRPQGPTLLPGWTNVYEGPRYLSDDGQRFFFETFDALTRADENGKRDIYEFERAGRGTCGGESPTFDPTTGGCHFLLSSGTSTDETFLLDASSDGRDVFFSTRSELTGWDPNPDYDVYDAREGGGFPEPSLLPPSCHGEACLPPPPAPPGVSAPATPNIQNSGNAVEKPKCRKGFVKKHSRCTKPRKRKHGRASDKRRARR